MSDQLFDDGSNPSIAPATPPVLDQETNYLETLVGEGKKFTDAAALAKGKVESDAFIEQLKKENLGLRGELNSRLAVEKFVDQVTSQQTAVQPTPVTPPVTEVPSPTGEVQSAQRDEITAEDLSKIVNEAVESRLTQAQTQSNVDRAMQAAIDKFGTETYKKALSDKASELGLGTGFLASIAEQNPETFISLMGLKEAPAETVAPNESSPLQLSPTGVQRVTPTASPGGGKNFAHYEQIRKTDPATYWSPAVQNDMMKQVAEMGNAFYEN